jgi:hypothetical protein
MPSGISGVRKRGNMNLGWGDIINTDPDEPVQKVSINEVFNQIYDTLLGNVGMSKHHTPFPLNNLTYQYIDTDQREIYFEFGDQAFSLSIKETPVIGPCDY